MNTYYLRLKKALINEHSKVFDEDSGLMKKEVREELNKCPVCGTPEYKIYCVKDSFVHKRCKNCSFVYVDPRLNQEATVAFYNSEVNEVYNENKFHKIEENAPDDVENLKNYELLRKNISDVKGKKLLEIGCGKGTFLAKAASDGFEVEAIELNKLLIERLKKITSKIYEEDILQLDLPENYYDVIYFRDVMEHIPSIQPFMQKISKILKPGGIVFIDTHNIDSLVNMATREYHTVIFAFEHPVHWSPKTLSLAGKNAGLMVKKVYFDHLNITFRRIIIYYLTPSFTYIFPPQMNRKIVFFWDTFSWILGLKYISAIDRSVMKFLSGITRKGAKMQVLFTKK